jgi:hypothetical protein
MRIELAFTVTSALTRVSKYYGASGLERVPDLLKFMNFARSLVLKPEYSK